MLYGAVSFEEKHQQGNTYFGEKKYEKAAEIWQENAKQGYAKSIHNLGQLYYFGLGVPKNLEKSFNLYKTAADLGQSSAIFSLGYAYYAGKGTEQDYSAGIKFLTIAAEQGKSEAQRLVGQAYYFGNGVGIDYKQAAQWYKKSAAGNDVDGQFKLAWMYFYGEGLTQNYYQSAYYYKLAAEAGNAKAQLNLGKQYSEGLGVVKDLTEAKKWIARSAELGLAESQQALIAINTMLVNEEVARRSLPFPDLPNNIEGYVHLGKSGCVPEDLFSKILQNQGLFPRGDISVFRTPSDGIHYLKVWQDMSANALYFVGNKGDGLYCVLNRYDDSGDKTKAELAFLAKNTEQKKMTTEECNFTKRYGDACFSYAMMTKALKEKGFISLLRGRDKSRDYVSLFSNDERTYLLTTNHITGATVITGQASVAYRNILHEILESHIEHLQRKIDSFPK